MPTERVNLGKAVYAQAAKVFSEQELLVVSWSATVINTLNRLGVFGRVPLPKDPA